MKIQTPNGEAEGMPLSDIQMNNKLLRWGIVMFSLISLCFLIIVIWLIGYVMKHDVVNNIVARCVG